MFYTLPIFKNSKKKTENLIKGYKSINLKANKNYLLLKVKAKKTAKCHSFLFNG